MCVCISVCVSVCVSGSGEAMDGRREDKRESECEMCNGLFYCAVLCGTVLCCVVCGSAEVGRNRIRSKIKEGLGYRFFCQFILILPFNLVLSSFLISFLHVYLI